VIWGFAPPLFAHAYLSSSAPIPNDVWVAPSVIGLDPTSQSWLSNLPKYEIPTAPQPATLVDKASPTSPPPENAAFDGVAPTVGPDSGKVISTPSAGLPGAVLVYGKFQTPLSNDLYAGADTALLGIVWGTFEIRRCDNGVLLGNGVTGPYGTSAGTFSKTIDYPAGAGFKVWIIPDSTAGSVRTGPSGAYNSYGSVTSGCFYPTTESYDIGTWSTYAGSGYVYRGAWMIYESIVNDARNWGTWQLFANKLGAYGKVMPYVIVRFPYETWAHYHVGGEIHLPTMNDARSPDVIQHEYAHFAMYQTYGTWFTTYCPSPHYINGVSHVNCAWSEGWASYVPYMAHGDKTYTYANNFDVNEETPTWGTSGWANGPAVEGRVTAALIDFADSQNEGWDITSGYLLSLWYIFRYKAAPIIVVNYHDFMAQLKSVYGYRTPQVLTNWQNTIVYTDL